LLVAGASLAAAGLAVLASQPVVLARLLARAFPGILWRVETSAPLAALTFDDGPDARYTPAVLDLLQRHEARATFFLIGERAERHPHLVRRIREGGHEIGNHAFGGGSLLLASETEFADSLLRTEKLLGLEGSRVKLFRPPSGHTRPVQLAWLRRRGYTCVLGSAYPYDPTRPPVAYIRWLVAKNLEPGAIVILHDGGGDRSRTAAALDGILRAGREKSLRFVTLSELIAAGRPR
jgi:peptidoglycan-N-acetylglucosamine deacetylase